MRRNKRKTEKGWECHFTEEEMAKQQPYAYWLNAVEKLGNTGKLRLLESFGSPEEIYCAKKESLSYLLTEEQLLALEKSRNKSMPEDYYKLSEQGIAFYPFYHPRYPGRLLHIPDRPFGLYAKGGLPEDTKRSIAIVGARSCSEYGHYLAESFGGQLAAAGVQIVSGLAKGIDGVAQAAAIRAGGSSFAVLGCGVDVCYPASHKNLYEQILESGGILSTHPPKTPPLAFHFPPRNRIISGLSDAVLVIEAKQKSGTLITVDMALEQGREVYVVPGRITDRLSDGCNSLLLQGAGAALSPAQLLQELEDNVWRGQSMMHTECVREVPFFNKRIDLNEEEQALLKLLDFYPISLDQIRLMMLSEKRLQSLSLPQTMEMLLNLSLKGCIKREGGCYALSEPI
ncbi:MAG: DNA-processing protein DprA [Lachnospiraceae bacterium]|nr:DNA-processing protein DprA [Lachnospiraceae bacterium]